eukprot:gnl/Hemi2/11990_TR4099_c0_g7_i1.p1 gnl/Hemi2/11990_TR4099_c0_g7~~gnl/Hemi2/11990_TR4099_c0_g7_i1.p1  ORF type:complete len:522 (+),score=196.60 gnl/Hemi2/11990_TR4099_c0_g7_i1:158-1723(+)
MAFIATHDLAAQRAASKTPTLPKALNPEQDRKRKLLQKKLQEEARKASLETMVLERHSASRKATAKLHDSLRASSQSKAVSVRPASQGSSVPVNRAQQIAASQRTERPQTLGSPGTIRSSTTRRSDDIDDPPSPRAATTHKSKGVEDDPWGALMRLKDQKDKERENNEKSKSSTMIATQRADLLHQMSENTNRKEQFRRSINEYGQQLAKDLETYAVEDARQQAARAKAKANEKHIREEQIAEANKRRLKEERDRLRHDKKLINKTMRELEEERKRAAEKKVAERQVVLADIAANEVKQQEAKQAQIRAREEDVTMMKAYSKKLDELEENRQQYFSQLTERMHRHVNNYWLKAGASLQEKAEADELKARTIQAEHERKMAQDDQARREKIAKNNRETKISLQDQIRRREEERQREIEDGRRWQEKNRGDMEKDFANIQREKVEAKQQKQQMHSDLTAQIIHLRQYRKDMQMNEHERKINAKLLAEIMTTEQLEGAKNYKNLSLPTTSKQENKNYAPTSVLR